MYHVYWSQIKYGEMAHFKYTDYYHSSLSSKRKRRGSHRKPRASPLTESASRDVFSLTLTDFERREPSFRTKKLERSNRHAFSRRQLCRTADDASENTTAVRRGTVAGSIRSRRSRISRPVSRRADSARGYKKRILPDVSVFFAPVCERRKPNICSVRTTSCAHTTTTRAADTRKQRPPTAVSARALARSETTVGVRVAPGRAPRTDYTSSSSSRHVRLSCVISRGKRSRARVPYPSTRSRPVPPGSGRIMKRCCVAMAARECIAHALHRRKLYRPHGASLDTPLKLRVVCAVQMSRPVAEVCVLLNVIRAGRKSGAYVLQYETPHPPPVLLVVVRPGELYEPAVEGGGGRLCLLNSRPRIT